MAALALEDNPCQALTDKVAAVEHQGNQVRALKAARAAKPNIDDTIAALNPLKLEKASIERDLRATLGTTDGGFGSREAFRQAVSNMPEQWLFYIKSFSIYGGVAELYYYGPPG